MSGKQVVLITGASRGMGLKAAQFLLEGTHSIPASRVVSLSRSCPAELLEVHKQFPNDLLVVQGDVTQEADNRKAVSAALDKWGRLDAVVLNSGLIKFAPLASMDPQTFADVLNVNLISLQLTLHVAVPALRKSPTGVGKIVVVSSGAAVSGRAAWGAYNVSKAGANALARTLATEEIGSNGHAPIAVFSLRPGQVDTQMQEEMRDPSREDFDQATFDAFSKAHRDGKLLKVEQPSHVIAALSVLGTRTSPATQGGEGLGAQGAFFNWNAPEVSQAAWQWQS